MAGLWQQLSSLRQGRALALLHFICLLYLPSGALPWDKKASPPPSPETVRPTDPGEEVNQGDATKNDIIEEKPHPNQVTSNPSVNSNPQPTYTWTKSGHTDWDVGEWSECSRRCGPGNQHRQVICRQVTHTHAVNGTETSVIVAPELCGLSDRPVTKSTCQLKICSQWEIRSDWSPCSVPCGVGQRSREVVCLSNQGDVEDDEECNMNLKPETLQNCDMGACARSWFSSLWSQRCSAECGQGNRTRTTVCLINHATDLPLDSCEGERPPEVASCDSGPCQDRLEWYAGPWGQCSAECGNGTQTRSLVCIFNHDGLMEVVDQFKCSSLPQPITAQPCRLKPCGVQWYVTDWSACSRSCNGGYRVREVRCLADSIAPSDRCDPSLTPESQEECNKQPCLAEINPSCSTSIITVWWWFKPDSASTLTTGASAAPPAPVPTKHTPAHFKRTTSADAQSVVYQASEGESCAQNVTACSETSPMGALWFAWFRGTSLGPVEKKSRQRCTRSR
ncbi:Thrombospondin type-1 domain-containing protein 4 [Nibea albiflora]|uniref:Thrombospondin type-1 domain-containing protein 4 n=1 Tax=Nibea albiflora TaxID=240163 RepID=A0ACB7FKJ9_NIBAL|nr:Thrombospondin type-1 domain-containing protein 4 [Nibea albiflora]